MKEAVAARCRPMSGRQIVRDHRKKGREGGRELGGRGGREGAGGEVVICYD